MDELKQKIDNIGKLKIPEDVSDKIFKTIAGRLCRIKYSSGDRYDYDNTFGIGTYPGIRLVKNVYRDQTTPERFLFIETYFKRQKNRIKSEIKDLCEMIDN